MTDALLRASKSDKELLWEATDKVTALLKAIKAAA
jgi:hypothetical protein